MTGPEPGSAEHGRLVTASKVAAIVGASPYLSPYALWLQMNGIDPGEPVKPVQERGHRLEAVVLDWWRDRHPNASGITEQPWRDVDGWAGARPDLHAEDDGHGNRCVVDGKTVARSDGWGTPGTDEVPEHVAIQVTWQMLLFEANVAYVPMLGPRLEFAEYVVPYDAQLAAWLYREAWAFRESLAADAPPPLDNSVATIASLRRAHPDLDPDTAVSVADADVTALAQARAAKKAAEAAERAALAPILAAMGTAKYANTPTRHHAAVRQASGRGITLKLNGEAP